MHEFPQPPALGIGADFSLSSEHVPRNVGSSVVHESEKPQSEIVVEPRFHFLGEFEFLGGSARLLEPVCKVEILRKLQDSLSRIVDELSHELNRLGGQFGSNGNGKSLKKFGGIF